MSRPRNRATKAASVVEELIAAFDRGRRFIVLGHVDPDLDCVGSQLALGAVLEALGKQVWLWSPAPLPDQYSFLSGVDRITTNCPAGEEIDVAIAVDTATFERLGDPPPFDTATVPMLANIDHHESNTGFGTMNWVDATASSVGEMLYELFEAWGVEIRRETAEYLYVSIASDTGGFSFSNTTARTFRVAGALVERGVVPFAVWRHLFGSVPLAKQRLLGEALCTLRVHANGRIATMAISQAMLAATGTVMEDSERFIRYPRSVTGAEVAVLLREQPDGDSVRVSLRSNSAGLDVSRIASRLGGGGHPKAAACTLRGGLDAVEQTIVTAITQALEEADSTT
ncbi:MAG: bifunctional oligoribonuclease/PAP phosphatase NrnA [Verrucomicrobia bacterium]|nr:bifunctional oligoribonuclease/PAP phosphatase NrnA [Verrucomicrobiota bacterium]